jgi:outer membrane receptor for ferrienterochelin and colicins
MFDMGSARKIVILLLVVFTNTLYSQKLNGWVKDKSTLEGLQYANVIWESSKTGVVSDEKGFFTIERPNNEKGRIIVSFLGYVSDTISISNDQTEVVIKLKKQSQNLDEVTVDGKRDAFSVNTMETKNAQTISSDGIKRLACCSLAECFENSNTVDVGYTDAVTGAKQIQMLGLSGVYTQILVENQPSVRILSTIYGLNYIPGPWLDAISISKGTASVYQGYESTTGQINIDIKKPERGEKLYLEYFTNDYLKQELNLSSANHVSEKLSTVALVHAAKVFQKTDRNGDGFLDIPLSDLAIGTNRWFYAGENVRSRFGFDVLYEDRIGGQTNEEGTTNAYRVNMNSRRVHVFENTGFSLNPDKNSSIGLNANMVYHEMNSLFGVRKYNPVQKSSYVTVLLNSDIKNEFNKISTGVNVNYDDLSEQVIDTVFERQELNTGVFGEYTYNDKTRWSFIAGLRGDYNFLYGFKIVPRFHAKYTPDEITAFRISAGRGLRTANIIAENISIMASSRDIDVSHDLQMEDAWNYGISFTHKYYLEDDRKITFNVDFYRTDFENQIVIDMDSDQNTVSFYNLEGKSYSNSFQVDVMLEPIKRFEVNLAYRLNDSKMTIADELRERPLVSKHKGLLALHYATKYEKWKLSFTSQYHGAARLPDMNESSDYILPEYSPEFLIFHAQVTRQFSNWEIYLGCENLTDYKQKNPIISADNPFGKDFDSSIIYAPIIGRQFNLGFRLKIE